MVAPEKGAEYPERLGYKENHPTWCRVPMTIEQMMDQMEEKCNSKLRLSGHSEMILEEMIGGRLYTGPMYIKYNTVLRSKTSDAAMLKLHKDLNKNNGYPTTIHAINSCVIKMSKLTKAGKVWRGIKDAALPKEFWVPNDMGVRGGIEYGFSSTTTDKEQALLYAGGEQSDASTIFEMQMGMVDRGANLTWLSQYPHEQEVLLPPLTGIEALNVEVDGSMLVIHSRLSLNLASHTLEQVLSRRRKMLMDMVSGIELELRDNLGEELTGYGIAVPAEGVSVRTSIKGSRVVQRRRELCVCDAADSTASACGRHADQKAPRRRAGAQPKGMEAGRLGTHLAPCRVVQPAVRVVELIGTDARDARDRSARFASNAV